MNKEIIEQAWLEYKKKLFLFIRAKVSTSEDAEDILNDVFEKLIKSINKESIPNNISSWLYHVTRNRIIDYYRVKKPFEVLPSYLSEEVEDTSVITELSKCMLPMIYSLPESYQQVLILSQIEDKKNKEVATEMHLSLSAVKSRILRGRKQLQKSMLDCCTIYRNGTGKVLSYEQKVNNFCNDCEK